MTLDEHKAMGPVVQALAAKDCALLYWTSGPQMNDALDIVAAWGFDYKTIAFAWVKTTRSAERITLYIRSTIVLARMHPTRSRRRSFSWPRVQIAPALGGA
jgi:N6-adenosine-specific RNA methylase IME4